MRILSNLNTYYRLLLLIISTTALFFLLYLFLYFYTKKQEREVYKSAYKEYHNEANSIFELNSKPHISAIIDVTFWDELVEFTAKKDQKWYKQYIEKEFPTYDVDYIGVFGLNHELLAKTTSSELKSIDFIPKQIMPALHKSRLVRFYLKLPEGVVEVFGATIHPSNDPKKNKTEPSGYFFMARLLNHNFIQHLEKISSSTIKITDKNYLSPADGNAIEVDLNLKDWKNEVVANLSFERPFNLNFYNTKKILFIIIIATVLNFLIYFYYYRRWVYKPIKLITNILEKEDENSMSSLKKAHGEFKHIGNLFEENTKQKKQLEIAKEKAEESDMLKSSFLANLSHEIRTPMNAIMGFSELLGDSNLNQKDRDDYLKIIRHSGKNLISIIEDLIEMSKIDSKQITPNYSSLDLDKCILELHHAIKVTIPEEKEIQFSIHENTEPLKRKILTDEIKLTQILTNLITNAIKFTKKGYVSVGYKVNEEAKSLEIWVEDSGLGIDENNIKIIFDRFRRIEDEFSIELTGLGLGLSITKAYVELLGGHIAVKSLPGIGSTFTITLPLKYDDTTFEIDAIATNKKLSGGENKTILIAEDDNINFLLLERILQLKNYKILRAVNGNEAVEICKNNTAIDLVFMDIKMPVMNGFEAFELIRQFNQNLPIIANTAYSSFEDKDKIINAGFTNYISKPLNKNEVFYLLSSILD
ncbi:response regulator [Pedobacter sp. LMG 31464]|uniref:histidine kinase n=1 Tax=Pedobacter planticolens TaxID=2679964 RepID=A0A923IV61_9SPHI|nr:ATP-binding protein [Pedobacter planticolens]MBB2145513.1 response regulator [Pedobacter planticolens]